MSSSQTENGSKRLEICPHYCDTAGLTRERLAFSSALNLIFSCFVEVLLLVAGVFAYHEAGADEAFQRRRSLREMKTA